MKEWLKNIITLNAEHNTQRAVLMIIITLVYFFNFSVNDIWTPNESFYADAVRTMLQSGNFLDIEYNGEARYNKPPMTYWLMALSAGIFGLSEFSLRFPIILTGIGSIWMTYLLGRKMFGDKGGIYAMVLVAFTIQFLAVKQYASPEMPLTFFFTLTLYWFYVGFKSANKSMILLSYVALGLTTLTKGFPYIIIIGGIIGLYVLIRGPFSWKRIWSDIKILNLPIGLSLTIIIGLSWVIFMYLKDGDSFWSVYYTETFGRALSKESNGLKPFFYLGVLAWSVIPCTLAFIFAVFYWLKHPKAGMQVVFPFCWFIVMLVIFTVAKGKIPTYMIQAHPAIILMIVPLLTTVKLEGILKAIWSWSFWLLAILILVVNFLVTDLFRLHPVFYFIPVFSAIILGFLLLSKKAKLSDRLSASVFWPSVFFGLSFALFLPRMEAFRPYDEIGRIVREDISINENTPILIQNTLIHNIPYYTARTAIRDASIERINNYEGETIALVKADNSVGLDTRFETIWSGYIYDFASESQFGKFLTACLKAEEGDFEKFALYNLIYRK